MSRRTSVADAKTVPDAISLNPSAWRSGIVVLGRHLQEPNTEREQVNAGFVVKVPRRDDHGPGMSWMPLSSSSSSSLPEMSPNDSSRLVRTPDTPGPESSSIAHCSEGPSSVSFLSSSSNRRMISSKSASNCGAPSALGSVVGLVPDQEVVGAPPMAVARFCGAKA
eukprot:CAMPEP_0194540838 /NCGR_PEP_ID=MMETSP0253-20130528/81250_1 /TAXON_ID=2966 /ORGANISM="Noctiluca scintillans" /LENGTH=165 /DNA_ID=CAMNT_0039387255 /DNA_START=143 /DNA_END=640 /DNA_ORIENTATION=+